MCPLTVTRVSASVTVSDTPHFLQGGPSPLPANGWVNRSKLKSWNRRCTPINADVNLQSVIHAIPPLRFCGENRCWSLPQGCRYSCLKPHAAGLKQQASRLRPHTFLHASRHKPQACFFAFNKKFLFHLLGKFGVFDKWALTIFFWDCGVTGVFRDKPLISAHANFRVISFSGPEKKY